MMQQSHPHERFMAELNNLQEWTVILLKGHLVLEEVLTSIIENHFFNREYVGKARLSFQHKMLLSRGLCLRKDQVGEWDLIGAINALRNVVAHSIDQPKQMAKLALVKQLLYREGNTDSLPNKDEIDESTTVMFACAHCVGFLHSFENDSVSFRSLIHSLDRQLNPDEAEFKL
jgi:hypothetical protein